MAKASQLFFFLSLVVFSLVVSSNACSKSAHAKKFGVYEIKKGDFSVKVTNWGATILSVVLPDSKGNLGDVVLGFEEVGGYVNQTFYFGALVGRVANRIAKARFVLDGTPYRLYPNDGNNTLHGGHRGFSHVFWTVKEIVNGDSPFITLHYHSFDGEQGFPGELDVYVKYKISSEYKLKVSMEAKPGSKATPVNLAQHTYWNLGGEGKGTILSHFVQIFASRITPVHDTLIPTGKLAPVKSTAFDFLQAKQVGSQIDQVNGGYDINYVLDMGSSGRLIKVAVVEDRLGSGRRMELWSNQPGVQFYTGNFLNGVKGKNGHVYPQHGGLCLETQGFPDSVNHPIFPSQIVRPGQVYMHEMVYRFSF